ncbi:type I methionyl aminopeptidase [Portibacter lacus]|uniref:Methionine aminopeptidase n=1 Tax=Portibacter lacus TaxID=1099794 RepID=A0AA37SWT6_9BACT|nr:type I methionyl aminopeptidase [Portibacter lacus]GLR19338.1 methionine aminopeptidase [Portibacter lacus]
MIHYKTKEEIELIRESCLIVSKTLALVGSILKPGMTGIEIDKKAEEFIRDHKAVPGFKGYRDFPATLCISPNEGVVHGIPVDKEFVDGDIISVDCGSLLNDYYGDSAFTFAIGEVPEETLQLLEVTNTSLYKAIEVAKKGNRLGDIGYAIQSYAEKEHGYGVVRELIGHGIGRNLHEKPDVPNYGVRGRGQMLKEGLVIAIEPMINLGSKEIMQSNDGWTIISKDGKPSAHYEHTIAITKNGPDILSNHTFIADAIKNNANINDISIKN